MSKPAILMAVRKAHCHVTPSSASLHLFRSLQTHQHALCPHSMPAPLGLGSSRWHSLSLWISHAQALTHLPPPRHPSPRRHPHIPEIAVTPHFKLYPIPLFYFLRDTSHSPELIDSSRLVIHALSPRPRPGIETPRGRGLCQSGPQSSNSTWRIRAIDT